MKARTYKVTLTGETPLLMHRDNIEWGERVQGWQKDPMHKKESVPGDDRSPSWVWLGYCYHDNRVLGMDADNIMSMLRDSGAKVPAARGRGSMKAATQSGIMCNEILWPLKVNGATIPWEGISALKEEPDFHNHVDVVEAMGFNLFVKRAKIGQAKHVRVRPRFDEWSITGTLTVLDTTITQPVLESILQTGGLMVGLGDWRPGSPSKPGQFGRFSVEVEEVK
jgi:hypothetical protein